MAEEDRRISLADKVLVDKLDAQLLEVQQQGQVVGLGVALTMAGRYHRRNERSTTTYLLYSDDIARLISYVVARCDDRRRSGVARSGTWPHPIGAGLKCGAQ